MARPTDWIEGARLRTLPAALAPVIVGTSAAWIEGQWRPGRALLALAVALFLQIGVNYANDYSDGVRGTDAHRQGPPRLTGGGLAKPRTVLAAALGCFAAAGVCGLVLVALAGAWWMVAVGACAIAAAWFYTGGSHPYGYAGVGLSELFVLVFFGLVATMGTLWTQAATAPPFAWVWALALGLLAVTMLMVNNLRDIPTDAVTGKRTLAVRLGDRASRGVYVVLLLAGAVLMGAASPLSPLPMRLLVLVPMLIGACLTLAPVLRGARGRDLIVVLKRTGFLSLLAALLSIVVAGLAAH